MSGGNSDMLGDWLAGRNKRLRSETERLRDRVALLERTIQDMIRTLYNPADAERIGLAALRPAPRLDPREE